VHAFMHACVRACAGDARDAAVQDVGGVQGVLEAVRSVSERSSEPRLPAEAAAPMLPPPPTAAVPGGKMP
jgi:hypothetical protein